MKVLVDTPVWSLALRRDPARLTREQTVLRNGLRELIQEDRAEIMGSIRQEVLSGIRDQARFNRTREYLGEFHDEPLETADYEEAARISNACMAAGVAGSAVDVLICAVALRRNWEIFTLDRDFEHYARVVKVRLYQPRHAH